MSAFGLSNPANRLSSLSTVFTATIQVAETAFTGAYLAATQVFSKSEETTPFAVTCAQIACVEQTHLALVRQIGKSLANNTSYAEYTLANVSSTVSVLQPFLDGSGEDFVGPVAPPIDDDIAAIHVEAEMLGYDNPGVPFAVMTEMPA